MFERHGVSEPQYARPPCPSPTARVHINPCPLSRWCHQTISPSVIPLLLLHSIFPRIRIFSNESVLCIRWPKYWSFSFTISPSNEHPRLISFRMDWLDLLAIQVTLKSLLQHHSSKAHNLANEQHYSTSLSLYISCRIQLKFFLTFWPTPRHRFKLHHYLWNPWIKI